jgi:neutral ceramidase
MKAGFCETDITPPIGAEQPGGYLKAFISRVDQPLKARAAVFGTDAERVAFVGIDTTGIERGLVEEIRRRITERTGIAPEAVCIAASHTHAGGPLWGETPGELADPSRDELAVRIQRSERICQDPVYSEWAVRQTASAVIEADRRATEARFSAGSGHEAGAVFNRRYRMKSGRALSHPGKGNPDIVEPAGPVDPEVAVLAAWNEDGTLRGCLVNYACHGTAHGSRGAHPDWIHYLLSTIRAVWGEEVAVVFLNGACGDITQVDSLDDRHRDWGGPWFSRRIGMRVGAEALKVLAEAEPGACEGPVAARRRILEIPRRRPTPECFAEAEALVRREIDLPREERSEPGFTFAGETLLLADKLRREPVASVEVQALQVGPVLLLANPAEYFCQLGLEIKERSPFPATWVVELANGKAGYVPTTEAFDPETGGGYETALTNYSNLALDAGNRIRETSLELAREFSPGTIASPADLLTEPGTPWHYGRLGPDRGEEAP